MLFEMPKIPKIPMIPDFDASKFITLMGAFTKATNKGNPFDPNSIADLKQALLMAVASYRIQKHYHRSISDRIMSNRKSDILSELLSGTDNDADTGDECEPNNEEEDAEQFDSATWDDVITALEEIQTCNTTYAKSLTEALEAFEMLAETYGEHLSMLLKVILTAPNDVQRDILGNAYCIDPEIIDSTLRGLLALVDGSDTYATMDDSLRAFIKTLNEKWAHLALIPE